MSKESVSTEAYTRARPGTLHISRFEDASLCELGGVFVTVSLDMTDRSLPVEFSVRVQTTGMRTYSSYASRGSQGWPATWEHHDHLGNRVR